MVYFVTSVRRHRGHFPGSSEFTVLWTGHVNETALVTRIRSRPHVGHRPACIFVSSLCTGQLHTSARRSCSSVIPQMGHLPGSLSTTSGCIGQLHDTGGSGGAARASAGVRDEAVCADTRASAIENGAARPRRNVRREGIVPGIGSLPAVDHEPLTREAIELLDRLEPGVG